MAAGRGILAAMPITALLLSVAAALAGPAADPAASASTPAERLLRAAPDLDPVVLQAALDRASCARARGELPAQAPPVLAVIDYSLPSTAPRLWVLDLEEPRLLFHERVAHGQGTGEDLAVAFSNRPNSHQSSLGLFVAGEVYTGQHGTSLRLDGKDPGLNDRSRERAIVVHGAPYVSEGFIARTGRLGRSWGCPAVATEVAPALIEALAGGAALYAWHPSLAGEATTACQG